MTEPEQSKPPTIRFGDLKNMMRDMVKEMIGDHDAPPQRQPLRNPQRQQSGGRSVDDEVRTAVEKLEKDRKSREERDARDKGFDDKISALEERTREKAPVERRRVHKIMGWGD